MEVNGEIWMMDMKIAFFGVEIGFGEDEGGLGMIYLGSLLG